MNEVQIYPTSVNTLESGSDRTEIAYREGRADDSYAVFLVFERTLADLARRFGFTGHFSIDDADALERMWAQRRSLYEHLAATAEAFWVVELGGEIIGFARAILRDGLRQLTELFVTPGVQSAGIGRELMRLSFPDGGADRCSIIATMDQRAQALYLKAGVYPRFPVYYFGRKPEMAPLSTDLEFEPIQASPANLGTLARLDERLVGHRRDVDHAWLLSDRQGYLYYRGTRVVGYGYVGLRNGPFGLEEAKDFPAVLAHAERQAAAQGRAEFGVEVPMINQQAVDYLLRRGFRLDTFMALMMNDRPFGKFENYILTSPPFFM